MRGSKRKRSTDTLLSSASTSTRSISGHALRSTRSKKIRKNTGAKAEGTAKNIDTERGRMNAPTEKEKGIVTIRKRIGTRTIGTINGAKTKSTNTAIQPL